MARRRWRRAAPAAPGGAGAGASSAPPAPAPVVLVDLLALASHPVVGPPLRRKDRALFKAADAGRDGALDTAEFCLLLAAAEAIAPQSLPAGDDASGVVLPPPATPEHAAAVRELVDAYHHVGKRQPNGDTPLHVWARDGDARAIRDALAEHVWVDAVNASGETALRCGCVGGGKNPAVWRCSCAAAAPQDVAAVGGLLWGTPRDYAERSERRRKGGGARAGRRRQTEHSPRGGGGRAGRPRRGTCGSGAIRARWRRCPRATRAWARVARWRRRAACCALERPALGDKLRAAASSGPVMHLHVSDRSLGDAGARALADALKSGAVPQLRMLDVRSSSVGVAGARTLADALMSGAVPQLQTLDVGHSSLGEAGARALADALKSRAVPQLQTLDACHSNIGEAGVRALADALASRAVPRLQSLYVSNNSIGDAGARALADALASRAVPQLQTLSVGDNRIGEAGARALARHSIPAPCRSCRCWTCTATASARPARAPSRTRSSPAPCRSCGSCSCTTTMLARPARAPSRMRWIQAPWRSCSTCTWAPTASARPARAPSRTRSSLRSCRSCRRWT